MRNFEDEFLACNTTGLCGGGRLAVLTTFNKGGISTATTTNTQTVTNNTNIIQQKGTDAAKVLALALSGFNQALQTTTSAQTAQQAANLAGLRTVAAETVSAGTGFGLSTPDATSESTTSSVAKQVVIGVLVAGLVWWFSKKRG